MAAPQTSPSKASDLRGRPLAVALLSAAALFMENLDATIITTGLPTMARDFGVTPVSLNVGITAYLLTLAVFIPLSGWMANRFGERRVFASAVLVFTIASALCGLSRTLPHFLIARVLQGVGGSMMVPVGRLMVVRSVTKPQLMGAIAYTIWPALTAPILGPVVGGYIIHVASWPWMFFLNLPIGILLFVLSLVIVRDSPDRASGPLDLRGLFLVGVTCLLLVSGLEEVQRPGEVSQGLCVLCAAVFFLLLAVWHLRRSAQPLFDLRVFQVRTFRVVMGAGSLFRMAVFSVPFLLPLLFQTSFGLDAFRSGMLVTAVFAGNLAMKPLTTPLLRRFGFRQVLLGNGIFSVALLAVCGWLHSATPGWLVLLLLFLGGAGRSMELTSLTTMGFADLSAELAGTGTTLATMVQQMTVSLGIATAALSLHLSALHRGSAVVDGRDFRVAFCVMAAFAACSLFTFATLPHDAGSVVTGVTLRQKRQKAT